MAAGNKEHIDIVALGGLGEIGKNTMAIEYGDEVVIIDAGLAFPDEQMLGVDIVIPDYSYLLERRSKIRAIVLTHGHEDHVGGLPYLLRDIDAPVYGTPLTLGLVNRKLPEHGISLDGKAHVVYPGDTISIGALDIDFFRVHHSIVDAVGLGIHTPIGTIVHSGDFKFDQTPIDGKQADFHKLADLGDHGVLCLLSDSTNADRPGYTKSERVVGEALDSLFSRPGRILVACFASNVPRMQQVAASAVRHGRYVMAIGRSMETVLDVAMEMGYVTFPEGVLIPQERIGSVPPERLVVLTTGTQGEPMSALTRMAVGSHRRLEIGPSDTVIISASAIPGNERLVNRTVDNLLRLGAHVVYDQAQGVHVSGHASQEELKLMLNLVRPQYFIPVHGQFRHLIRHAEIAESLGVAKENILVGDNGTVFRFSPDHGTIAGRVPAGNVMVDGLGVGDVGNVVLRDRQQLSEDGVVVVVLTIGPEGLAADPEVVTRGFVYVREAEDLLTTARELVRNLVHNGQAPSRNRVRDALGKYLYEETGRRPMIIPIVITVDDQCPDASTPS